MNNRVITFTLIGLVLAFFVIYFSLINLMLQSEQNPGKTILSVRESGDHENWDQAIKKVEEIKDYWGDIQYLMMLNFSTEDFNTFEEKLEDMNSAVNQKDKDQLHLAANQALYYWNNMIKLVPKP